MISLAQGCQAEPQLNLQNYFEGPNTYSGITGADPSHVVSVSTFLVSSFIGRTKYAGFAKASI